MVIIRRYGVIVTLAICVATAGLLIFRYRALWWPDQGEQSEPGPLRFLPKLAKAKGHLYFSDADNRFLTAEYRTLVLSDTVAQRAKDIMKALIEGPIGPLSPTMPAGTKVLALYVTQDGMAYVDFNRAITENHPGGTFSELLTIFSIVNTLVLNIPEIEAVKILIEGREADTLAGHIDLRRPFRPNMLMIK
jgi:hypothetical protein